MIIMMKNKIELTGIFPIVAIFIGSHLSAKAQQSASWYLI
jgi:hypothetical protein